MLRVFLAGLLTGAMAMLAVADLSTGAPWYWVAFDALCAIAWAIVLRNMLRPPVPRAVCLAAHWVGGEIAFLCLRSAGHRGKHRERTVAWDDARAFLWRGRRTR